MNGQIDKDRLEQLKAQLYNASEGRSLDELKKSKGVLKGAESQRLRQFCTSECMEPGRDLDAYGRMLYSGSLQLVRADHLRRVAAEKEKTESSSSGHELPEKAVAAAIYAMKWGPTEVPIYNLLGLLMIICSDKRTTYLQIAKYLIETVGVPVDGTDLSGTRALSHSFSTKPAFDLEYAQMLYDAGGDVNGRNRYGTTVATEIVQIYNPSDRNIVDRAKTGLSWFFAHGGNIDIEDGDGLSVRKMLQTLQRFPLTAGFVRLATAEDAKRKRLGDTCCALCGRDESSTTLARCSKCKTACYCARSLRGCQVTDWPRHKKLCKAAA